MGLSIKIANRVINGDYPSCLMTTARYGTLNISEKNATILFDEFFEYRDKENENPIYDKNTGEEL
jgi:hypothetical protein